MCIAIFIILYLIVFCLSIYILKKFSKTFDMNYDEEKTYANYDDWDSNSEAAVVFSMFWPLYWCITLVRKILGFTIKVVDKIK